MSQSRDFDEMEKGYDVNQAVAEASRCLLCHDAPCSKGCPGGTKPADFIRKLRFRNITGAIRTIKTNNILGGACGVLCPSERLCELECCATGIDRPINIGKIQRFLVEQSWNMDFNVLEKGTEKNKKVAIVGSGPAGLSCAATLAQKGYSTTVFEKHPEAGGVLRYGVPEHRFSKDFLNKELDQIKALGVEFQCNSPIEGKGSVEAFLENGYDAVFVAPGLWESVSILNSDCYGVYTATDFLMKMRDGSSATLKKEVSGKTVAVIGGGSVAIDCVESAKKLGANDVYLVYRRSYTQMPAENEEKMAALNDGVHFLHLNQPVECVIENNVIKGLKLRRTKLGESDESGRRKPVEIGGSDWTLDCDVIIEAIGSKAVSESKDWYPGVETDKSNIIQVDKNTKATSKKGVFAGGDIINGPALIINAVNDGKIAAESIHNYLEEGK